MERVRNLDEGGLALEMNKANTLQKLAGCLPEAGPSFTGAEGVTVIQVRLHSRARDFDGVRVL